MAMIVCGIDEAGRGPIAGPVTAAAVILPPDFPRDILDDSKKISPAKRDTICLRIVEEAEDYGTGWVWPHEIDLLNIHYASLKAMELAFSSLKRVPDKVYIDGKFVPYISAPGEAVVHGDALIPEIMAASIVAKTVRDRWMIRYSWIDDRFGFEQHKGYPTRMHRERCLLHGLSVQHRRSFKII